MTQEAERPCGQPALVSDQAPAGLRPSGFDRAQKKPKRPRPARGQAFGILNPYGDMWTTNVFDNEAAARRYVEDFWLDFDGGDLTRFRVIPVKITVSAL